jgi:hypothetical protein
VFLNEKGGKEARKCYRKSADGEEGGDICNLCSEGTMEIWCAVRLGGQRSIRTLAIMIRVNFGVIDILLWNWGHVLTPFFDTCQGKWYCEGKIADLEETKTCTGSGAADRVAADGLEEYSTKMLVHTFWWSADESCRWIRRKEGNPNYTKILIIRL